MTDQTSLAAALAALQAQLPRVGKDATNPHFKSKYATLEAISAALLPLMAALGLSFSCRPTLHDGAFVLAYRLLHSPTGEYMDGQYPLPSGNPQQIGSAITYARRYSLCAVTGLAPDDDDDGNEASGGDSKRSARSLTPAQQKAARTAPVPTGTPTQQREDRRRRIAEERAVAQGKAENLVRPEHHQDASRVDTSIWENPVPEDRPGTASSGQKRAIEALLTKAGCATGREQAARDERHAVVLKYLPGLEALKSMNHLSFNEAAAVIRALSADTGDEKMPQTVPDHGQLAANDWPEDPWAGDAPDWTRS